jgi:hypothetical protein
MALNLMKISKHATRLVTVATSSAPSVRLIQTQAMSFFSSNIESNLLRNSQWFKLASSSLTQQQRFYSATTSDNKLNKSQIEEKVLDILRNFDRIKENPNKPSVFEVFSSVYFILI